MSDLRLRQLLAEPAAFLGLFDDQLNSKMPIADATAPLVVWDAETRLRLRGLVIEVIKDLRIAEACASGLDRAFAANEADSTTRANTISCLLANASRATEKLVAGSRTDPLIRVLKEASNLTDLRAQGQGFGDALTGDLAAARAALTKVANDFRDTDLPGVDLGAVLLVGVRWDAATRWPPGWVRRIRLASEEEKGFLEVFVIRAETDRVFEPAAA